MVRLLILGTSKGTGQPTLAAVIPSCVHCPLAAAASTLGWDVLRESGFWWCVAGLVATGVLNLAVSFWLALKVALRSRGITLADRQRLYAAVRRRVWQQPRSFLLPERAA